MEDNIDLPEEYFNKDTTLINDTSEEGVYSLDVDDRSISPKKTTDQQEEAPVEVGERDGYSNPSTASSSPDYNVYNNTSEEYNTVNKNYSTNDESAFISNKTSNNVSNFNEEGKKDINYNFYSNTSDIPTQSPKNTDNEPSVRPTPSNDSILEQIKNIDGKINGLTSKLNNINSESRSSFNNIIENNKSDYSVNNDYSIESDEESPVTVVPNLFYSEKQQIRNNIFTLNNQKNKLLSLLNATEQKYNENNLENTSFNNSNESINNTSKINNESISNVEGDFSPNLINNTEKSLEKAIVTEKVLGGEPKIVDSPQLGKVVIDERQGTLENAINEHGGIENAIRDSKENQNLVENFFKENNATENITNFNEGGESIYNMDSLSPVDTSATEAVPDNNQIIAKDTSSILSILNNITTQLNSISNNLLKLKGGGQGNNSFAANFYTSDGKSNTVQPTSNGSTGKTAKTPMQSGIKGNLPIADYFPKDFNVESLGVSNLLSRI